MSWFSSSNSSNSSSSTITSTATTTDYKPLGRDERKACWEARDSYFSCLDKHEILDALKEGDAAGRKCADESRRFEGDCASSWVKYFKQKRVADFDKERRMRKLEAEGAVPLSSSGARGAGSKGGKESSWKFW